MENLESKITSQIPKDYFSYTTIDQIINYLLISYGYKCFDLCGFSSTSFVLDTIKDGKRIALKVQKVEEENIIALEISNKQFKCIQEQSHSTYLAHHHNSFYLALQLQENTLEDNLSQNKIKYFCQEMDLYSGNLESLISDHRARKEEISNGIKEKIAIQLLDAINLLHQRGISHFNIKPQNILHQVNNNNNNIVENIALSDVGHILPNKRISMLQLGSQKNNNSLYMSEESGGGSYIIQSDLFSIGIILIQLDNILQFDYSTIDFSSFIQLYSFTHSDEIFSNYQLNRDSLLFKIASTFLQPKYENRSSSYDMLIKLLSCTQNRHETQSLYSIIIQPQLLQDIFSLPSISKSGGNSEILQQLRQISNDFKCSNANQTEAQKRIDNIISRFPSFSVKQEQTSSVSSSLNRNKIQQILLEIFSFNKYDIAFELLSLHDNYIIIGVFNILLKRKEVLKIVQVDENTKSDIQRQLDTLIAIQSNYHFVKFIEHATFYLKHFNTHNNNNDDDGSVIEEKEYIIFTFERCEMTLKQLLQQQCVLGQYDEELKMQIAQQMIDCISLIHHTGYINSNITLNNFYVTYSEHSLVVKLHNICDVQELVLYDIWNLDCQFKGMQHIPSQTCFIANPSQQQIIYQKLEVLCSSQAYLYNRFNDWYSLGICLSQVNNNMQVNEQYISSKFIAYCEGQIQQFTSSNVFPLSNSHLFNIASRMINYKYSQSDPFDIKDTCTYDPFNTLIKTHFSNSPSLQVSLVFSKSVIFAQQIKDKDSSGLLEVLEKFKHSIETLQIEFMNICDKDQSSLYSILPEMKQLTTLHLRLSPQYYLNSFPSSLQNMINLTNLHLDLAMGNLGLSSLTFLSNLTEILSTFTKLRVLYLYLCGNMMYDERLNYFSASLGKLVNLNTLSLQIRKNFLRADGMKQLSLSLKQLVNLSKLEILLYDNCIKDEGMQYLTQGLMNLHGLTIFRLDVREGGLEQESGRMLSEVLMQQKQLKYLQLILNYNQIQEFGVEYISSALKQLHHLISLQLFLYGNSIQSQGVIFISAAIKQLTELSCLELSLEDNDIDTHAAIELFSAILPLKSLYHINIGLMKNQLDESCLDQLASSLEQLPNLIYVEIDLENNLIKSNQKMNAIKTALHRIKNLKITV